MEPSTSTPANFHAFHGENIELLDYRQRALRRASFEKGFVFSERPLRENENFLISIESVEVGWAGHLRIGLTSLDPNSRPSHMELERRSCFVAVSPTSAPLTTTSSLPTEKGSTIGVYYETETGSTRLHVVLNGFDVSMEPDSLQSGLPLYAVVDVFGSTKEIRIVGQASKMPQTLSRLCSSHVYRLICDGKCSSTDVPLPLRPVVSIR